MYSQLVVEDGGTFLLWMTAIKSMSKKIENEPEVLLRFCVPKDPLLCRSAESIFAHDGNWLLGSSKPSMLDRVDVSSEMFLNLVTAGAIRDTVVEVTPLHSSRNDGAKAWKLTGVCRNKPEVILGSFTIAERLRPVVKVVVRVLYCFDTEVNLLRLRGIFQTMEQWSFRKEEHSTAASIRFRLRLSTTPFMLWETEQAKTGEADIISFSEMEYRLVVREPLSRSTIS
ncbi:hypothetical protein Tco_0796982 [Tanacetum coccineum]